ncbi:MAG: SIS domain-containing protein [Phycisphaerae bacterium]
MPTDDALRKAGQDLLNRIEAVMEEVDWGRIVELAQLLPTARRTFLTGAGRSGLVARSFGMRLMHAGLPAYIPGETITPATGEGDLLVAISCTGETGLTGYFVRRARQLGARVVVVTANESSTLASQADEVVLIPASAENIVIRAAVFEHATSLCLDAVFNVLSERLKLDMETYRQRHANLE